MKKIPTIFNRDWDGDRSRVVNSPHKDCDWVFLGEGRATLKLDGACCMVRDGKRYKRRELKDGQLTPLGFEPVSFDDETIKTVGWMPVRDGPEDRYFREAICQSEGGEKDGTYELVGPKVQGGVERMFTQHELIPHGAYTIFDEPQRNYDAIRDWLSGKDIEGLVYHHPDGRMAKIKLRDFGLKRTAKT
jgi:Family of unknown function (DUF5565)